MQHSTRLEIIIKEIIKLKNFGIGLSLGLIGAILLYVVYPLVGLIFAISDDSPAIWVEILKNGSYALMIGSPIVYWIICPVVDLIKRRKG